MADTPQRTPSTVAPPASRIDQPTGRASKQQAGQLAEDAKQQASRLAEEAKQRGRTALNQQKERGKTMLDQQKGKAAGQLGGLAGALHQTASQCAQRDDQQMAGRVLEQAASGLDRIADSLRSTDVDSLLQQATSMVRRQPAVFIGGTIAIGFLLSRFLKSSSERPHGSEAVYGQAYDEEAYEGYESDLLSDSDERPYVTSAHVNPGEVNRPAVPPVTPTGRRDF